MWCCGADLVVIVSNSNHVWVILGKPLPTAPSCQISTNWYSEDSHDYCKNHQFPGPICILFVFSQARCERLMNAQALHQKSVCTQLYNLLHVYKFTVAQTKLDFLQVY